MKRTMIFIIFIILTFTTFSQVTPVAEVKLGRQYIPRDFVHAGKDFKKGVYIITLNSKGEIPYFFFHNKKMELLFEEMAVVKPYTGKSKKFRYKFRKEMLKGYEYFRLKVIKPDNIYLAFLLVKTKTTTTAKKDK